jgi:precorrin-2 dehydrogenase/sirohydrochlorin ferrochelatase
MPTMPLNINMQGKKALLVGGGPVATRKMHRLLEAGSNVTIVTLSASQEMENLQSVGSVVLNLEAYDTSCLDGVFLVVAATGSQDVNIRIAKEAKERGILVLVADAQEEGDCTFPAVLRRGELEIAVSSGGRSPAFSAMVRDRIAQIICEEYGILLERTAVEREKLLTEGNTSTYNNKIVRDLAERLIDEMQKP